MRERLFTLGSGLDVELSHRRRERLSDLPTLLWHQKLALEDSFSHTHALERLAGKRDGVLPTLSEWGVC